MPDTLVRVEIIFQELLSPEEAATAEGEIVRRDTRNPARNHRISVDTEIRVTDPKINEKVRRIFHDVITEERKPEYEAFWAIGEFQKPNGEIYHATIARRQAIPV